MDSWHDMKTRLAPGGSFQELCKRDHERNMFAWKFKNELDKSVFSEGKKEAKLKALGLIPAVGGDGAGKVIGVVPSAATKTTNRGRPKAARTDASRPPPGGKEPPPRGGRLRGTGARRPRRRRVPSRRRAPTRRRNPRSGHAAALPHRPGDARGARPGVSTRTSSSRSAPRNPCSVSCSTSRPSGTRLCRTCPRRRGAPIARRPAAVSLRGGVGGGGGGRVERRARGRHRHGHLRRVRTPRRVPRALRVGPPAEAATRPHLPRRRPGAPAIRAVAIAIAIRIRVAPESLSPRKRGADEMEVAHVARSDSFCQEPVQGGVFGGIFGGGHGMVPSIFGSDLAGAALRRARRVGAPRDENRRRFHPQRVRRRRLQQHVPGDGPRRSRRVARRGDGHRCDGGNDGRGGGDDGRDGRDGREPTSRGVGIRGAGDGDGVASASARAGGAGARALASAAPGELKGYAQRQIISEFGGAGEGSITVGAMLENDGLFSLTQMLGDVPEGAAVAGPAAGPTNFAGMFGGPISEALGAIKSKPKPKPNGGNVGGVKDRGRARRERRIYLRRRSPPNPPPSLIRTPRIIRTRRRRARARRASRVSSRPRRPREAAARTRDRYRTPGMGWTAREETTRGGREGGGARNFDDDNDDDDSRGVFRRAREARTRRRERARETFHYCNSKDAHTRTRTRYASFPRRVASLVVEIVRDARSSSRLAIEYDNSTVNAYNTRKPRAGRARRTLEPTSRPARATLPSRVLFCVSPPTRLRRSLSPSGRLVLVADLVRGGLERQPGGGSLERQPDLLLILRSPLAAFSDWC